MSFDLQVIDPAGLIRESYRIEGIRIEECRSIFLDWAIKLPAEIAPEKALQFLLETYGKEADHPMSQVLIEGLGEAAKKGRRGGSAARHAANSPR
ncbi:MAG: hypothetical protein ACJA2X_001060 [Halocynthiibacter sp.]|jgi:hypothetical protein